MDERQRAIDAVREAMPDAVGEYSDHAATQLVDALLDSGVVVLKADYVELYEARTRIENARVDTEAELAERTRERDEAREALAVLSSDEFRDRTVDHLKAIAGNPVEAGTAVRGVLGAVAAVFARESVPTPEGEGA